MKLLLLKTFFLFALVKGIPVEDNGDRYFWFADSNGDMLLVDSWENSQVKFDPDSDIKYFLHTRKNPTEHQEIIKGNAESLFASHFNMSNPVKITIHGLGDNYNSPTNILTRDAFLRVYDVNMISVDWGIGASGNYLSAVSNTLLSGPSVADFLDWMNDMGVPFSNMHIIGHSLGGHMSGIIGRNVKGIVEYITALDPAFPLWGDNSERIRKTDAKYVEILHTNSGILGMIDAVGHNDFYPNGGRIMAGCSGDFGCSHARARNYFAESIVTGGFTAVQCNSVDEAMDGMVNCTGSARLHMGGPNIKPELGIFALETNPDSPYSQG